MLFGILGFVVGLFVGGALVFFCFALVAAGADEEEMREHLRRHEDNLK